MHQFFLRLLKTQLVLKLEPCCSQKSVQVSLTCSMQIKKCNIEKLLKIVYALVESKNEVLVSCKGVLVCAYASKANRASVLTLMLQGNCKWSHS